MAGAVMKILILLVSFVIYNDDLRIAKTRYHLPQLQNKPLFKRARPSMYRNFVEMRINAR